MAKAKTKTVVLKIKRQENPQAKAICTARHYIPERTRELRSGRIEVMRVDVPGAGLP